MEIIKLFCENGKCTGKSFRYSGMMICPLCNSKLSPDFSDIKKDSLKNVLVNSPVHIAAPLFQLFATSSYYKRLHYISDTLIGAMRLSGNLLISAYQTSIGTKEDLNESIEKISKHETHGAWPDLIFKLHVELETNESTPFTEQFLPLLGKSSKTIKKEKLFSVENSFTDEYGKLQKVKSEGTPAQLLINFRNRYLGHGTVISEEESKDIYETYLPIFTRFLEQVDFLSNYKWIANRKNSISGWNISKFDIEELLVSGENEDYTFKNNYHIQFTALSFLNSGNYHCSTINCVIHENKIGMPVMQNCPSCDSPLVLKESELMDKKDILIINEYPYLIAFPYNRAILEQDPYKKIHILKETFLNYLKYMGLMVASEYFNSDKKIKSLNANFRELLYRPQFGYWNRFIRESIITLNENNHQWFIPELPRYYEEIETAVYEAYKTQTTPIGKLIDFRNRYLGHGMVPGDEECRNLWDVYFPLLKTLLLQMDFCRSYSIVSYDNTWLWRLMGTEFTPVQAARKSGMEDRVQIINAKGKGMNLVPFFVLPGEFFRKETSSRAKLMVYEQNTGKRIIFFSPESVTDETSGKVLERLNLILSEKDKEETLNETTLTNDAFAKALNYRNAEIRRALVNERKVIEGIYQEREDAEIALRSWVGARAGLFFSAAEAGSGKTNLLMEMSKQYSGRKIHNLVIRANRMTTKDLWEEIKHLLNLSEDFSIVKAEVFKQFSQENPFIILIDGGNEHSHPEELLNSIFTFLTNTNGGSIKVVLSWRVNTKGEIPEMDIKFENLVYAANNEEREENILAKYCHWLKPLNKIELEGAWNFYNIKNSKTHKPQFSLADLTYHDRALTDQLNNPLMLRLFLELFHNKSLPKSNGFINIWSLYHEKLIAD
ncbi:MAG: hypothetical protein Q8M29_04670 [Bacteroidota bacterium]|nr:hypothetical protein [Bacteroidota bacterium]